MIKNFLKNNEQYFLGALLIVLLALALSTNILTPTGNDLSKLGWSFLHGKTYFINDVSNADIVLFNNQVYLAIPPLPAAIFIPFDLIGQKPATQNIIASLFLIPAFVLIYLLARKLTFSLLNSLWLALCYFFGSVFIIAVFFPGNTNFFCHVLTTILLAWALLEFLGLKRYLLIGLLIGLALLTRPTAGLSGIFFFLFLTFEKNLYWRQKLKQLFVLALPIFICGFLLFGYNYLRFNNPWENSYTLSANYQKFPELRPYGLFSYQYIPDNFYHYFLELPGLNYITSPNDPTKYALQPPYLKKPNFGSLSFFLVAPLFLLLFRANRKNKTNQYVFFSAGITLLVLLNYYYNGWPQIGSRYFNDFLPLLFLVLLFTLQNKGLNYKHKIIIALSAIFNTALLLFF